MLPPGAGLVSVSGEISNGQVTIMVLDGTLITNSNENQIIIDNGAWLSGEIQ